MRRILVSSAAIAMAAVSTAAHPAEEGTLAGGGTYIVNSTLELHSVMTFSVQGIDTKNKAMGTVQYPHGHVMFTSVWVPGDAAEYFTDFDVDCVMLESYDRKTGNYELVLSGVKNDGSRAEYDNYVTSDGFLSGLISVAGDNIVGRLQRVDGLVSRSDWTSGYETCTGEGQELLLDDGSPNYRGGTRTTAEFEGCDDLIGIDYMTATPTCESFAPGGYNYGALPVDRTLGGDISFQ